MHLASVSPSATARPDPGTMRWISRAFDGGSVVSVRVSRLPRPQRGLPHVTGPLGGAFLIPRPLAEEPHSPGPADESVMPGGQSLDGDLVSGLAGPGRMTIGVELVGDGLPARHGGAKLAHGGPWRPRGGDGAGSGREGRGVLVALRMGAGADEGCSVHACIAPGGPATSRLHGPPYRPPAPGERVERAILSRARNSANPQDLKDAGRSSWGDGRRSRRIIGRPGRAPSRPIGPFDIRPEPRHHGCGSDPCPGAGMHDHDAARRLSPPGRRRHPG